MKILLILLISVVSSFCFSQSRKAKTENYFGLNYKPLIPFGLVGDKDVVISKDGFEAVVSPKLGYSFGGTVRIGISKLLAFETGILYTRRNYNTSFKQTDSLISAKNDFGIINFDIPLNGLVYIQLSEKLFANTSLGISGNYNPSNIRTQINPEGKHQFILEGRRSGFFSGEINANVGFEYRTEKNGFFYIGIAGKIPFAPIFKIATAYQYDTFQIVDEGKVEGATFALDFKYFFHNTKNKGKQFKGGPIDQ